MKRAKRLTKKERQALAGGPRPQQPAQHHHRHIHCVACGKHLDPEMFDEEPILATWLTCQHHSQFPSCVACRDASQALLDEHDRTGQPVRTATAWH